MSYQIYKVIHFLGLFMIVASVGGQILHAINGGGKVYPGKKWVGMQSGIGLLLLLLGGFGMLARLGTGFELWVILKVVIWLVMGFIGSVALRKANLSKVIWVVMIALLVVATGLAVYKPF